jgi:hypothetical protein
MQAAVKQVMAAISGNHDWINLLPPNRPLSAAEAGDLMARLSALAQMRPILAGARCRGLMRVRGRSPA